MLELINIVKDYVTGDDNVHALKGININFRNQEFVAILGHSGCGKTTLLNIIGGLDRYTEGDLIIEGRSTEEYSDSDWDSYRNHSIGFVFQSYNLIPHQSVLSNVELALTLTGVKKSERRRRAVEVLTKVGLKDQIKKKPNQLSGGQMQRVAIARALINDPDILLADEPTGALDSETSIQLMELLKSISKDKLIIMVTHNPDLASSYANRTIKIVDGSVVEDSSPYSGHDEKEYEHDVKTKKPSMSFLTAFGLSLNNLLTKKTRTILTAFAGSIGIIGIAMILSMSNGIQNYIKDVQEDTLSSYPLTIDSESVDMSGMVSRMMGDRNKEQGINHELDKVYFNSVMYDLMNSMTSVEVNKNNMTALKKFLEKDEVIADSASSIQYSYGEGLDIYTKDSNDKIVQTDVNTLLEQTMESMYGGDYSSYFQNFGNFYQGMDVWEELLTDSNSEKLSGLYEKQYDLVYGSWPDNYDELVLIIDKNNEVSDMIMYALGLRSQEEMATAMDAAMNKKQVEIEESGWSYEEICNIKLKLLLPSENYRYDERTNTYTDLTGTDTGMSYLFDNDEVGIPLKIVGIIKADEDTQAADSSGAIAYTKALTDMVLNKTGQNEIIQKQLADKNTDIISGLPFTDPDMPEPDESEKRMEAAQYMSGLDDSAKAELYKNIMSVADDAYVNGLIEQQMSGLDRATIEAQVKEMYQTEMNVDADTVESYISKMDDATLFENVRKSMDEQIRRQYKEQMETQLSSMSKIALSTAFDLAIWADWQYIKIYDDFMPSAFSDSTYEDNMKLLGYINEESPDRINIYASSFDDKEKISDAIERYNSKADKDDKIEYTDYVQILLSSVTTIINAISYVLIAFVAISLIVSSIMIGIITYISVLERTKEIGILRSIGASRKDISRVFNAETFIVGLVSGLIGIGGTLLMLIPANIIIRKITDINQLNAALPVSGAITLIVISVLLTFISGLIPSRIAARKNPVEALRTE